MIMVVVMWQTSTKKEYEGEVKSPVPPLVPIDDYLPMIRKTHILKNSCLRNRAKKSKIEKKLCMYYCTMQSYLVNHAGLLSRLEYAGLLLPNISTANVILKHMLYHGTITCILLFRFSRLDFCQFDMNKYILDYPNSTKYFRDLFR